MPFKINSDNDYTLKIYKELDIENKIELSKKVVLYCDIIDLYMINLNLLVFNLPNKDSKIHNLKNIVVHNKITKKFKKFVHAINLCDDLKEVNEYLEIKCNKLIFELRIQELYMLDYQLSKKIIKLTNDEKILIKCSVQFNLFKLWVTRFISVIMKSNSLLTDSRKEEVCNTIEKIKSDFIFYTNISINVYIENEIKYIHCFLKKYLEEITCFTTSANDISLIEKFNVLVISINNIISPI